GLDFAMGRTGLILSMLFASAAWGAPATQPSAKDVFSAAAAHAIDIRLSAEAWDALQPGGAPKKALAKATREEGKTAGVRLRPNSSGYAYVLCEMEIDGRRIPDVGLRFKGNSSYAVSAGTLRRPM